MLYCYGVYDNIGHEIVMYCKPDENQYIAIGRAERIRNVAPDRLSVVEVKHGPNIR